MPNPAPPPGLNALVQKASAVQISRALGRLADHVTACERQAVAPEPPARFFAEALGLELLGIEDERAPAERPALRRDYWAQFAGLD